MKSGNICISLRISIHTRDLTLLKYIQSVLKLGNLNVYPKTSVCRLVIGRIDLQEVIFPILIHHHIHFLTEQRVRQYNMAMYILKENVKSYSSLPSVAPSIYKLPVKAQEYANLNYFKNWIVGFTVSEGSFCITASGCACFQLKQKEHFEMFESFNIVFNSNKKIGVDKYNNSQFRLSSKADVQTAIIFFSSSGLHPLIGYKAKQYEIWIDYLKSSKRYKEISFPD
jgi:hypothetical protein